jgi:beta-glucosidase
VTPISSDGKFTVSFVVKNTGDVEGREVAQVYVSDPISTLPRPVRELKGFSKVSLKPGESKKATVELGRDALGYYNERLGSWIAEKGTFQIAVAASSRDVKMTKEVELKETFTWSGL